MGAWTIYPAAKHAFGAGLNLQTKFRLSFVVTTGAWDVNYSNVAQLSAAGVLAPEKANYPGSLPLGSGQWTGVTSARGASRRFDLADVVYSVGPSGWPSTIGAVVFQSGSGTLLCLADHSAQPATSVGNHVSVLFGSSGLFTLL